MKGFIKDAHKHFPGMPSATLELLEKLTRDEFEARARFVEDIVAAALAADLVPQMTIYRQMRTPVEERRLSTRIGDDFAGLMISDQTAPGHTSLWAPHEQQEVATELALALDIELEWNNDSRIALAWRRSDNRPEAKVLVHESELGRYEPLFACRLAIIRVAAAIYRQRAQ